MNRELIGIFKVNNQMDGGYYIDKYLKNILLENNRNVESYALHNTKVDLAGFVNVHVNYKNPVTAILKLHAIIKSNKLTTVYTNQFIPLLYFLIIKKIVKSTFRVIAKVDGLTTKKGIKKYTFHIYDIIYKFIIKKVDHVIYETETAMKSFEKYKRIKASLIYTPATNFYKLELPEISECDNNNIILYVGRYSEEKGFNVIGDLAKIFSDVIFIMIGGEKNYYKDVENIQEIGRLNIGEIISYYKKCSLLIVPSVSDAFPTVIREFSYFNKPIVATNVGAIHEFKELGISITLTDPNTEDLANSIRGVLDKKGIKPIENRKIYYKYFDPNNNTVKNKYINILTQE